MTAGFAPSTLSLRRDVQAQAQPFEAASPERLRHAGTSVRVDGIVKRYGGGGPAALEGVSLAIEPGELLALLGPSGSGKTTLLRVIAGLEIPDGGRVFFGSQDTTDIAVQSRGVGFVFQHYALFRHLTVFENIAYGLRSRPRAHRPKEDEIRRRVERLLELVQLPDLARRYPGQLSGGQRQRVALARALAVEPSVLLLDEPFGALDAQVRKDLRRWLREIHRETGQTTIFVTHDQDEALELADRIAILNRGRIEQVGAPHEVQDHPASRFVMSFVGETARLPAEVSGGEVRVAGRPVIAAEPGWPQGPVDLCLRPWDLTVGQGPGTLPGTVREWRRTGRGTVAEILLDGAEAPVEVKVTEVYEPGDRVALAVGAARVFARG
ncbi:sulfate transport system ATP-binding protein [Methylobacterium sp. 174MFSha1.1]|uniref:sulfate/molybdate ABC transporter ATP-binding protein n=1 Tax=Methylobacterium sp. 174MFSha1.1 TaxID=1502749 RepID=UPI0008EACA13|nr:sulfate/molybdate ABC transporter ATP-binding protein [Methylobacterium sp. 174MFSha1.1]SFV17389.1 sulfate transport system ATP-binding protein [Methylobacterium sp. 174MFSha1.1]